jgi:hypothetical protein
MNQLIANDRSLSSVAFLYGRIINVILSLDSVGEHGGTRAAKLSATRCG